MKKLIFSLALLICFNAYAETKDTIRVTGSASVYPVLSYIYENIPEDIKSTHFSSNPVIESVGTGAGFDSFCKQNFNLNSPDIINASREITQKEVLNCQKNDIKNIQKITVGLDGITLAYSLKNTHFKSNTNLTIEDVRNALSKYIVKDGKVIENQTSYWSDINSEMPKIKMEIYGPNSNSGTFDFLKSVIRKNCMEDPTISAHFKSIGKNVKNECSIFRDQIYKEMQDQDSVIAQKIYHQNNAVGILRFAFFNNSGYGRFGSLNINGTEPTEETIVSGKYKLARPLFIYFDSSSINKVKGMKFLLSQIAKFSYRDLIDESIENEYDDPESSNVVVQNVDNREECTSNKNIIGFKFNCG